MSRILRWLGRDDREPARDIAEQETVPMPALPSLPVRLLPRSRRDQRSGLPRAPRKPPGGTAPRRIVLLCGSSASTGLLLQQEAAPYLYAVGAKASSSGLRWTAADGSIIQFFSVRAGPLKWITAVSGAIVVPLYRQDASLAESSPGLLVRTDTILESLAREGKIHLLARLRDLVAAPSTSHS